MTPSGMATSVSSAVEQQRQTECAGHGRSAPRVQTSTFRPVILTLLTSLVFCSVPFITGGDSYISQNGSTDSITVIQYWRSQADVNKWAKGKVNHKLGG